MVGGASGPSLTTGKGLRHPLAGGSLSSRLGGGRAAFRLCGGKGPAGRGGPPWSPSESESNPRGSGASTSPPHASVRPGL